MKNYRKFIQYMCMDAVPRVLRVLYADSKAYPFWAESLPTSTMVRRCDAYTYGFDAKGKSVNTNGKAQTSSSVEGDARQQRVLDASKNRADKFLTDFDRAKKRLQVESKNKTKTGLVLTLDHDLETFVTGAGCHQYQYKRIPALVDSDSLGNAHYAALLSRLRAPAPANADANANNHYVWEDEIELLERRRAAQGRGESTRFLPHVPKEFDFTPRLRYGGFEERVLGLASGSEESEYEHD